MAAKETRVDVKPCAEITLLARLYLELAEDEASDTRRTEAEAVQSMAEALRLGDAAYTFVAENRVVGYALVSSARKPPYLRHFYICRDARRHGYGTEAFHALLKTLGADTIDLDVFVWNERGNAFWKSLGFTPRATIMRYQAGHDHH